MLLLPWKNRCREMRFRLAAMAINKASGAEPIFVIQRLQPKNLVVERARLPKGHRLLRLPWTETHGEKRWGACVSLAVNGQSTDGLPHTTCLPVVALVVTEYDTTVRTPDSETPWRHGEIH